MLSLRPLWLDENYIFENIRSYGNLEIFGPLKNCQAFPRAYLLAIKLFSASFNYHLIALRLFPFIAMLISFFVWKKIYAKTFHNQLGMITALLAFSSSYAIIYYSSELKPYSMDVLATGIFCLYMIFQSKLIAEKPSAFFTLATILLPLLMLVSYASFFVFWLVIVNFLCIMRKNNSKIIQRLFSAYGISCFLLLLIVYAFDVRFSINEKCLLGYWNDYFICSKSLYCFWKSFGEGFQRIVVYFYGNTSFFRQLASMFIPLFIAAAASAFAKLKRERSFGIFNAEIIGLIMLAELFVFGIFKKYPFTGERITLFFAPFTFLFISKGLGLLKDKLKIGVYYTASALYISFLFFCTINSVLFFFNAYAK